jgi:cell pole-organizing protein PopZ
VKDKAQPLLFILRPCCYVNSLHGCDITRRMRHPVHDDELIMEEALAAIRQAMTKGEVGEMTLVPAEPRSFREQAGAKPTPEAGLLSHEATAAIGSAFNTLTETVKKHEPTLEDIVRETLRPMLNSWLDENLPRVVERMVQAEVERITRGR